MSPGGGCHNFLWLLVVVCFQTSCLCPRSSRSTDLEAAVLCLASFTGLGAGGVTVHLSPGTLGLLVCWPLMALLVGVPFGVSSRDLSPLCPSSSPRSCLRDWASECSVGRDQSVLGFLWLWTDPVFHRLFPMLPELEGVLGDPFWVCVGSLQPITFPSKSDSLFIGLYIGLLSKIAIALGVL